MISFFVSIGLCRIFLIFAAFTSPLLIYQEYSKNYDKREVNLCIGKEWYRFHSNLFSEKSNIFWLKSKFKGQLPFFFESKLKGSWQPNGTFNNMNEEKLSHYSSL